MQKKIKRGLRRSGLLSLGLVLALITGCSENNGAESGNAAAGSNELQTATAKPEGKTTVKFWSHQNNLKDKMTELINAYNESNEDNIEIQLNVVADKYSDVLSLAFTSGEGPDIFTITGPSGTRKWAENQWAEPLNDYITDEFKNRFREGVWVEDNNLIDGKIYTLPDTASTSRLIYNKELFKQAGLDPEAPPATFAELREYAGKITAASSGKAAGYGLPLADGYNMDVSIFNGIGPAAFGLMRGFDYSKGQFDFAPYTSVLTLFADMEKDGSMLPGAMLINGDQGRAKFAEGSIGMMGGASWDPGIYSAMDVNFEIGVADFPTVDGRAKGKPVIQTGSGYMMSALSKNKEKVWKAMEFLNSSEFVGEIRKVDGSISLITSVADNPEYQADIRYLEHFQIKPTDAVWPPFPAGLKLQGDSMQNAAIQVITGAKKAEEVLADLTKRYNEAFEIGVTEGAYKRENFKIVGFDPLQLK